MLDRILLRDNPFIGVNHLSRDNARGALARLNVQKIADVMHASFSSGANGFVFSTHPLHLDVLELLKKQEVGLAFDMYPLLPYAQAYVRTANEKGTISVLNEIVQRLTWGRKVKAIVGGGISTLTMNPYKLLETFIDIEVNSFLRVAPANAKLGSVFLHEIVVDLALSFQLKELFERYISHINDKYGVKAGLVTRNFDRFVNFLENSDLPFNDVIIMAPFNKIGFQMNPSREACEEALVRVPQLDVIAMSVLAAGLLVLDDALEYIRNNPRLRSIVVGVSREEHARETFKALKNLDLILKRSTISNPAP
jgi:hypothetical protein